MQRSKPASTHPWTGKRRASSAFREDRIIRSDFGRVVDLDLATRNHEIAAQMYPLDIVFDAGDTMVWQQAYLGKGPGDMAERLGKWMRFHEEVVLPFQQYNVPTIQLARPTPKEAVCQVFEKVNTGGVTLTVFELLTATYAAADFELRKDWEAPPAATQPIRTAEEGRRHSVLADRYAARHLQPTAVALGGTSRGRQGLGNLLQAP